MDDMDDPRPRSPNGSLLYLNSINPKNGLPYWASHPVSLDEFGEYTRRLTLAMKARARCEKAAARKEAKLQPQRDEAAAKAAARKAVRAASDARRAASCVARAALSEA